jgi:hypothetical protein
LTSICKHAPGPAFAAIGPARSIGLNTVTPHAALARETAPSPTRPATSRTALALAAIGVAFVGVWIVVASITTCLNETPGFFRLYAAAAPGVVSVAHGILQGVAVILPPLVHPDGSCQPSALAWLLGAACALYLAAILLLEYSRARPATAASIVLAVWLASHTVLLAMPGLLSTDVFAYASYGRIAGLYGGNPYVDASPSTSSDIGSPGASVPNGSTVYGPLWTHIDATVAQVLAAGDPVQLLFAYRLIATLAQVANLAMVWWLTGQWTDIGALRWPRVAAFALYAWSPLALFELAGDAHNEALMLTSVLLAFVLLTLAVRERNPLRSQGLWIGALLALALGALVKFVPLAIALVVGIVWQRRLGSRMPRLVLGALGAVGIVALTLVVSWPWLDSSDILRPVLGIARGGAYYRYAWQDSPADILKIKLIVPRMPDVHDSIRTDLARGILWGFTRVAFVCVLAGVMWQLLRRDKSDAGREISAADITINVTDRDMSPGTHTVHSDASHGGASAVRSGSSDAASEFGESAATSHGTASDGGASTFRDTTSAAAMSRSESGAAAALIRRDFSDAAVTLRTIASASAWLVLAATLLLLTQVVAWYFLWTLPMVALLGWRTRVARCALSFGLSFFVAFYLGEFQPFGTPYLTVYALVALVLIAGSELVASALDKR